MEGQLVRDHLVRWPEELVDLTRRNQLLSFRHTAPAPFEFTASAHEVGREVTKVVGVTHDWCGRTTVRPC